MSLVDITGRAIRSGLGGWSNVRLIPASNAHETRGLEEIAAMVRIGSLAPDTPVIVATREVGTGGLPPVVVAVPLSVEELRAWQHGDRTVTRDVVEALDGAYEDFLEDVRTDRVE